METYGEIKEFLDSHPGIKGSLTIDLAERSTSGVEYFEIADNYVVSLGFKPIHKQWKVLNIEHTIKLLSKMLNRSMAYGLEMMPAETAKQVVLKFVEQFDKSEATYLSNGDYYGDSPGWNPITKSTMEMAVVIFDSRNIGIICVEDED